MIAVRGSVVLEDRLVERGVVQVEGDRIAAVLDGSAADAARGTGSGAAAAAVTGGSVIETDGLIVPGFVDVHVHGIGGYDTLDGDGAVEAIAAALPRSGVTAFCPTAVAAPPDALRVFLAEVGRLRDPGDPHPVVPSDCAGGRDTRAVRARVLPAHLESVFISPEYAGAQPREWLRDPAGAGTAGAFSASDVCRCIEAAGKAVGIVTLAPELPGALALVSRLTEAGVIVSLGHSAADAATAAAAFNAGARHVTHAFNRMRPMTSREPGLLGAALWRGDVRIELIADGAHVCEELCRLVLAVAGPGRVMAITDATAAAGLARGARARLGGRAIVAGARTAELADGTMAGGLLTMDHLFRHVHAWSGSAVDAVRVCATTPARAMGCDDLGVIRPGASADLVLLDRGSCVRRTLVGGRWAYIA